MEEQPSPTSAASGDNFGSFFADPAVRSSQSKFSPPRKPPPFQSEADAAELPPAPKPTFMANLAQPWGLFQSEEDNGPAETVRHPLMGQHPLSDEDDDAPAAAPAAESSPSKLPTASAASTTKTFSNSPEAVTSAAAPRPALTPSSLSFSSLSMGGGASSEVSTLRRLARQGAWRALVDKVKAAKKRGSLTTPVEEVNYGTYHLLGLMKLRGYGAAADELTALGDLDAPHYLYDQYPSVYPGKSGSMVPFALRWMHAELPHRAGQTATTMERLYALLAFCNSRIESLQAAADEPSDKEATAADTSAAGRQELAGEEDPAAEEVGTSGEEEDFGEFVASETTVAGNLLLTWAKRKEAVVYALVGHHLYQKQFVVALQWLNQLLARSPADADLLSKVGYVQLQLGDLLGAQQTFAQVDALLAESSDDALLNLAGRNRGLLHFAEKQYAKAFNEFAAVLGRDPHDTVSANNKALCLMYSRELVGATSVLEDSLQSSPRSTLNETVVLNLCSMYELASMNSIDSKRTLSTWLLNHAPDDFDLSCTRL